jgi:hypothetical protein
MWHGVVSYIVTTFRWNKYSLQIWSWKKKVNIHGRENFNLKLRVLMLVGFHIRIPNSYDWPSPNFRILNLSLSLNWQEDMYKQCESDALTFKNIESVRQSFSPRQQYTVSPFALCIIPAEGSTVPRITATVPLWNQPRLRFSTADPKICWCVWFLSRMYPNHWNI